MPSVLWERALMRGVSCPPTDPVTFALLSGDRVARFPELPGWAAGDWARRACAEHAALREKRGRVREGKALGRALAAARAALFLESIEAGSPRLALTSTATLRALAGDVPEGLLEEVAEAYSRFAAERVEPRDGLAKALTEAVA